MSHFFLIADVSILKLFSRNCIAIGQELMLQKNLKDRKCQIKKLGKPIKSECLHMQVNFIIKSCNFLYSVSTKVTKL